MKLFKIILLFIFSSGLMLSCHRQITTQSHAPAPSFEKQYLKKWTMRSTTQVKQNDEAVSKATFDTGRWWHVTVPTTVLRALVKEGVYPDPHFDLNNFKIPDASDSLNRQLDLGKYSHLKDHPNPFKDPYWFRTTFTVPATRKGQKTWLNFDGINYRADIWLNGRKVADAKDVVGMFRRYKFDITPFVIYGSENTLAVKIHQVDHIGTPKPGKQLTVFGPQRGWGVDIFKDATLKFSAGWDCAPVVRDRNMGIYQDVYLTYTGDVDIIDPYIVTDLPLPDTTSADIIISTGLKNTSGKAIKGILKGKIEMLKNIDFYTYQKTMPGTMEPVFFEKKIEIPAGKTITVHLNPEEMPQLHLRNPHLWWPNDYGEQYLHKLTLRFEVAGEASDLEETTFGIRELTNELKELNGEYGRVFYVNGTRIFLRGGWLQPDMLLDMNKKRMYAEARLLANAHVNVLATEDMPSPPDYVMDTYDKYGLLMWETFFQCWTSYPGTPSFANPLDADLAVGNALDIIKRYRNHPSLLQWTLQCETIVREEIYSPVRRLVKQLDKTRPFIPTSSLDWDVDSLTPYMKLDLPLGMTDDGAPDYTWYPHPYYYKKVLEVKQQMFRDEMGVPSVPVWSSMKKFIFDLGEGERNDIYPLDKNWAHHGAWDDGGYVYKAYDEALRNRYGQPADAKAYIRYAQYVHAGSYRAMYEAANHRMWDITTGVMLWKLNATWPTVVWQLYDWFLNPTSAYYFTKKALEPLHIQLNEHDHTVSVINRYHREIKGLKAEIRVFDFDLKEKWHREINLDIGSDRYRELLQIPEIKDLQGTYFVKLTLKDAAGQTVSGNFYWFSTKKKIDFTDLAKLKPVDLNIHTVLIDKNTEILAKVTVENTTKRLAFMNRLMVTKGNTGEEVLPTIWSDNFFTLLPGEKKTLTALFAKTDLGDNSPIIMQDKN